MKQYNLIYPTLQITNEIKLKRMDYTIFGVDFKQKLKNYSLKYSVIAGIVMILFNLGYIALMIYSFIDPTIFESAGFLDLLILAILLPLGLLWSFGWIVLSIKWSSKLLFYTCNIIIALLFLTTLIGFILFLSPQTLPPSPEEYELTMYDIAIYLSSVILMMVENILFGVALLKTGKKGMILILGIWSIISGLLAFTFIIPLLMAPIGGIIGTYILYKEWENTPPKNN